MKSPVVYILASERNGTLYVGVTSDIARRVWEHRTGAADGFTRRYRVHHLVHMEPYPSMEEAIIREKLLRNGAAPGNWT
jgi:putative endonuclease